MITLNQKTKIPWIVRFYGLSWLLLITLIITFLFGGGGHRADVFSFVGSFMFWVAMWLLLDYASISYIVNENTITINSGILIKKSKSIPFSNVQSVNSSRGIVAMIFGVSRIKIWTASAAQIQITNGNSDNKPSGSLLLKHNDVEWLKEHILKRK